MSDTKKPKPWIIYADGPNGPAQATLTADCEHDDHRKLRAKPARIECGVCGKPWLFESASDAREVIKTMLMPWEDHLASPVRKKR